MPRFAFTTRLAFNEAENVAELLLIREPEFERQRRGTLQPRATPWVRSSNISQALKGRDNGCAAPSGLDEMGTHTQGVALGWYLAGPLALSAFAVAVHRGARRAGRGSGSL
jgi:hypothetical protein